MPRDAEQLLRAGRDELYLARVLTTQLRNKTKTLASAYLDSEQRLASLIDEIEDALDGSPDQEVQGHDHEQALAQAH